MVIKPRFERASDFADGLAPVQIDGQCGYITTKGNIAIQPQYESAHRFSCGAAVVRTPEGLRFIAHDGHLAFPELYFYAESFVDDVAIVQKDKNGSSAYMDRKGRRILSN